MHHCCATVRHAGEGGREGGLADKKLFTDRRYVAKVVSLYPVSISSENENIEMVNSGKSDDGRGAGRGRAIGPRLFLGKCLCRT